MFKNKIIIMFLFLSFYNQINTISFNDGFRLYEKYIDHENMFSILNYLYAKQPSFFFDNPMNYYPLNEENIEGLFYAIEPLVNFFEPLLWGNIVFPISLASLAHNFDNLFQKSNNSDIDKVYDADVIIIAGGTYPAMKKQLLYVNKLLDVNKPLTPLFLLTRSERKNTNLYYELYDNIVSDIQSTINRVLTDDDLFFIRSNLDNEYTLALIIKRFFNLGNLTVLDWGNDGFLLKLNDFLESLNFNYAKILFMSNNIFTLYNELKYTINAIDDPFMVNKNYPVVFGGQDIELIDLVNKEGIFLRKLKMLTVLLNIITENIDE